jgi:hypothetical protein
MSSIFLGGVVPQIDTVFEYFDLYTRVEPSSKMMKGPIWVGCSFVLYLRSLHVRVHTFYNIILCQFLAKGLNCLLMDNVLSSLLMRFNLSFDN